MNSDTLTQLLQKSFRVTLGATATLVESLQDPQRRTASLERLTQELSQLTAEWETRGQSTEGEAREFINRLWQQSQDGASTATVPDAVASPETSPAASPIPSPATPAVQRDLQELTAQIAAIRAEIERLRVE